MFYVMNAVGNMSEDLSWINKINIFGAFNPARIINGSADLIPTSIFFVCIGVVLYGLSIVIFNKKDLSL